jgi:hypothetical protein
MAIQPVAFLLSLGTWPINYSASPAQFASDLVDRLTITPSAPWTAFQLVTNNPQGNITNIGPQLYDNGNGMRWEVYNSGTAQYVPLTVDGAGIINDTIPLSAMGTQTPGGIFIYDASGNPTTLAPASMVTGPTWVSGHTYNVGQYVTSPITSFTYLCTSGPVTSSTDPSADSTHWTVQSSTTTGDVLTQSTGGLPAWQALPGPTGSSNFEITLSAPQSFTSSSGGTTTTVQFNTSKFVNGSVTFTSGSFLVNISANQTWYFYTQAQFDYAGSAGFWQVTTNIVSSGGQVIGGLVNSPGEYVQSLTQSGTTPFAVTPTSSGIARSGTHASGIMAPVSTATTVLVQVVCVETPGSTNISMQLNSSNQRFGGFRIS